MSRHLLRAKHRGAAIALVNLPEVVAIGAAAPHVGCRKQASFHQPATGTLCFHDVPDAWIAGGEARRAVAQAIPSTSIME
jgi:hypothetical protein